MVEIEICGVERKLNLRLRFLDERLKLDPMFFCSSGYTIIYERGANAETMVRSAAAEAEQKGLSDFSRLWHDGCVDAIIEAQDVDRNHSSQV